MCENHLRSARGEGDVPLRVLGSDAGGDLLARALQGIPKVKKDILWFCAKKNPKKAKKRRQFPVNARAHALSMSNIFFRAKLPQNIYAASVVR